MSSFTTRTVGGPHGGQPVLTFGAPVADASAAMLLLHGRGASAQSMESFAEAFGTDDVAYVAPQAAGHTWYPQSFLAPLDANEPWLTSALAVVQHLVGAINVKGLPLERVLLLGFSQGACLASEAVARHPQRYGGLVALSGGLIGTATRSDAEPPNDKLFTYEGSLEGTPVFIGCSDVDAHIPVERVHTTADVLADLGGAVDKRIYPGMGHTVNDDEVQAVRTMVQAVASA